MAKTKIPVDDLGEGYPEVISPEQLRQLLGLKSRKTIDAWTASGRLDGCFRRRRKYNLIVKKLALDRLFNGPDWSPSD